MQYNFFPTASYLSPGFQKGVTGRVAPGMGIAQGTDPKKIETQLMTAIDEKESGEAGMAISFLGRETCRPKNRKCGECVVNKACTFYAAAEK